VFSKLRVLTKVGTVNVPASQVIVALKVKPTWICRPFPDDTVVVVGLAAAVVRAG